MILGLKPRSRYDWEGHPMVDCFEERPQNIALFHALPVQ